MRGPSVNIVVTSRHVTFGSDFGPAIGKVLFQIDTLVCEKRYVPRKRPSDNRFVDNFVSTLYIKDAHLRFDGTLSGQSLLKTFVAGVSHSDPWDVSNSHTPANATDIRLRLGRLTGTIDHEYNKMLVVDAEPVFLQVTDVWLVDPVTEPNLSIEMTAQAHGAHVSMALWAIPTFVNIIDKVYAMIEEKRATALAQTNITDSPHPFNSKSPKKPPTLASTLAKRSAESKRIRAREWSIIPKGSIAIKLGNIQISLFAHYFYDSDCVQTKLEQVTIKLNRREENAAGDVQNIARTLEMRFSSINLARSQIRKFDPQSKISVEQWASIIVPVSSKEYRLLPQHVVEYADTAKGTINARPPHLSASVRGRR